MCFGRDTIHCHCDRERVLRAVGLLEVEELQQSARDGESLEIVCQFCAERYAVTPEETLAIVAERRAG